MNRSPSSPQPRLLFHWPGAPQLRIGLPSMILLAALAHGAALVIFAISYPAPTTVVMPRAEIILLPSSPDGTRFHSSDWLRAKDPALFSPAIPDPKVSDWRSDWSFSPSFELREPEMLAPPRRDVSRFELDFLETGPVPFRASPLAIPASPWELPRAAGGGRVMVSGSPDRIYLPPGFQWPETSGLTLQGPGEFMVAVDSDGRTVSSFLLRSSGDRDLDDLGTKVLRASSFPPAPMEELRWSQVEFFWDSLAPEFEEFPVPIPPSFSDPTP